MRRLLCLRSEELPAGLRMPPNKHKAESLIRPRARYTGTGANERQRTAVNNNERQ